MCIRDRAQSARAVPIRISGNAPPSMRQAAPRRGVPRRISSDEPPVSHPPHNNRPRPSAVRSSRRHSPVRSLRISPVYAAGDPPQRIPCRTDCRSKPASRRKGRSPEKRYGVLSLTVLSASSENTLPQHRFKPRITEHFFVVLHHELNASALPDQYQNFFCARNRRI